MTFSQIKNTMLMYKDYLVWSGLEQNDTKLLYKFWVYIDASTIRHASNIVLL